MTGQTWRTTNLVLSAWLALSGLLWFHSAAQLNNVWIVGALVAAVAFVGELVKPARGFNIALAAWLAASAWLLPVINDVTFRNNIVVAVVMFVVAIAGMADITLGRRPVRQAGQPRR